MRSAIRRFTNRSGRVSRYTPSVLCLTDQQKSLYDRIVKDRGKTGAKAGFAVYDATDGTLAGPWNAMVGSPLIGGLAERMGSACRHDTACPGDLFEVAILTVAVHWKSQFEFYAHEKLALAQGVDVSAIAAIKRRARPYEVDTMTQRQRAVYAYALEVHATKRVREATHREALAAVGGEQALIDLVLTMGFYNQIALLLNAFEVPLPTGEEPPFDEPNMS